MRERLAALAVVFAATGALAGTANATIEQARETGAAATGTPACTTPAPQHVYGYYHCYSPQQMRAAYGVNQVGNPARASGLLGQGQTIVLVDSYGSPTAANDLQYFHDTYFPNLPNPNFTEVYPQGAPDYNNVNGGYYSGPGAAAGWSGEATLDIEWSYAMAPLAHIVLLAVPPAETEGVQGFPNLFKAVQGAIDTYPAGTIFSMSFGVTEQTFEGAYGTQTAKFDQVFQNGIAKGDTFFASSGDNGSLGVAKQHLDSTTYSYPTDGWPTTSPYVTSAGGTQLQYGWTWNPQSDISFNADGSFNAPYWQTLSGGNLNVVWNESWLPAASGGGPSAIYSRPAWQNGVLAGAGNHRLVPDISWDAAVNGGALVYITAFPTYQRAGWHVYGGTSSASPQLAGLTALAEQQAGHPLGNINPVLYAHPRAFTDVVPVHQGAAGVISGDLNTNRMFDYNGDGLPATWDSVTGWPTLSGYDMTTGLGTPNAPAYVTALAGH